MTNSDVTISENVNIIQVIQPHVTQATNLYQTLLALTVTNDTELAYAADKLREAKQIREKAEAIRVALVKPLNDHVKFINSQFKQVTDKVDQVEVFVKSLMKQYYSKKEEARKQQQATLDDALVAQGIEPVAIPEQKTTKGDTAAVTFMTTWTWEMTDFAKVPDDYKQLDQVKINYAVRSNGIRNIPGIRIFSEQTPAIKGQRG
jgi:hypothetical protein